MKNEKTYYAKQSISLAEEAKQSIVVPSDIITECNEHINYMKSFIENEEGKGNM